MAVALPADALPCAEPVHIRHVQVHENDIEAAITALLYGFHAAAGQFQHSHAGRKRRPDEFAIGFVIVHRED